MTYRPNQIPLTHNQMDAKLEKPNPRTEKHDGKTPGPYETPPPPSFKQRRRKKPKQPKRDR